MIRLCALSTLTAALVLFSSISQAQELAKPNLSETNIREPPKSTPHAGVPTDYVLIPADTIGPDNYLRFDTPVTEIKVDNPNVLVAMPNPNDPTTVILRPQQEGITRVIVYGVLEGLGAADLQTVRMGGELAAKKRLLYDAQVAVGSRVVILRDKGVREIMDCAPGCYPSPTNKQREPDQIVEQRNR